MDMAALADISFQYMHECIQVASLGFDVLCVTSHNITANDGKSSQLLSESRGVSLKIQIHCRKHNNVCTKALFVPANMNLY